MAETGKKKITVEKMIPPFGETKTKKAPEWFSLRPGIYRHLPPVMVKRTMELDPRKWSKKVLEDGVYAVVRYELALFSTQLATCEKKIMSEVAKEKSFKKKLPKNAKDETEGLTKVLDTAEKDVIKLYKAVAKKMQDKISLALDEVESDKGDNKKALATGKEALKRFDNLDTSKMFSGPTIKVTQALSKLSTDLKKSTTDKEADTAFKAALKTLRSAESDFESVGKTTRNVVKYLLNSGDKMARDKKSAPALQAFGKKLADGAMKKKLGALEETISDFGFDLDDAVNFAAAGSADADDAANLAKGFANAHKGDDRAASDAVKEVQKLSKEFKAATKDLK